MPTLKDYYLALAGELGEDFSSTASAGSTTVALVDSSWPMTSTMSADDQYANNILWRPDAANAADRVRRVKSNTAVSGTVTPDHNWQVAPAPGEAYHLLTGQAPVDGSSFDMRTLINEGLKLTIWPVEILGTPVLGATRHFMDNVASWLKSESWILRVGILHTGEDRNQIDPYSRVVRGRMVRDGDGLYIDHYPQSFPATDLMYVELLKPGWEQCRHQGGTFGDVEGLSADTDECPLPVDWVTAASLIVAWRRLRMSLARNPDVPRNRLEAAAWFTRLTRYYLNPLPRTFRPAPSHFGPYRAATGNAAAYKRIVIV